MLSPSVNGLPSKLLLHPQYLSGLAMALEHSVHGFSPALGARHLTSPDSLEDNVVVGGSVFCLVGKI